MLGPVRHVQLRERVVCVVRHAGPADTVDEVRRPLYRHMIIHELVGGPSIVRWPTAAEAPVDALVVTHLGFDGDEVCQVETLPAGVYAVADYEGPHAHLAAARREFEAAATGRVGPTLRVHLMDEVDGVSEQQFQALAAAPLPP